jgi:branched-chain amino acid aminotransferase
MIHVWHITPKENIHLDLDVPSLDEVTRQLPDGFYSTFRTYDGCKRVLGLRSHLQRLYEPVSSAKVDQSHLRRQLAELLSQDCTGEARVRLAMTRDGEAYIAIQSFTPLPREVYEHGVRVVTTTIQRHQPQLKSTSFISQSQAARSEIAREGIFEALLVKDGKILEGMTSNFFYVPQRGGMLCTAREEILPGVTRQNVIEIALGQGIEVRYEPLATDVLSTIAEAFITSSSRGIVPVIQIDDHPVGEGIPGPLTRRLMAAYEAYVLEQAERI